MRPSDKLKPTKSINVNERKMLETMDEAIDKPDKSINWQPTGKHPDKKNLKTH
jgi:hypothetical protein